MFLNNKIQQLVVQLLNKRRNLSAGRQCFRVSQKYQNFGLVARVYRLSLACCIIVPFFLQSCGENETESQEEELKAVKYARVEQAGGVIERTYSGRTQSSSLTNLSFRTGGLIVRLNVKVGQRVKKGMLLAQLDQKDAKLAYEQALVDVQSAKVQYDNAASSFQRTKQLYETNNASLSEYEQAKTQFSNAESSYEISLKRLDLQKSQISYTRIIAPMSGVISAVNSELNEVVKSGATIIVMSKEGSNDIEAQVGLPEKYINEVQNGDTVLVSVGSLEKSFRGIVTEIGFTSSRNGVTYPVTVSVESKENNDLRPDMPAEVRFRFGAAGQKSVLMVPIKAIGSGVNGNFVFKLSPGENAHTVNKVTVELGNITQYGYEIRSGVSEGDLVAVAGLSYLYEGRKVKLLEK